MLNVDGWTDGRTYERMNVRKLAHLCLPAKAGATKIAYFRGNCACREIRSQFGYIQVKKKNNNKKQIWVGASRDPILSLSKGLFAEIQISAPNTRNQTERYDNR